MAGQFLLIQTLVVLQVDQVVVGLVKMISFRVEILINVQMKEEEEAEVEEVLVIMNVIDQEMMNVSKEGDIRY